MSDLPSETRQRVYRTLGEGVVKVWSRLPAPIQHELFEAAVVVEGEAVRQQLAVFLHHTHDRTRSGLQQRAMPEPDSHGG